LVVRNAASPLYLADAEEIAFIVPGTSAFDGQSIAIAGADGSRRTLVKATEGIWIQTISPDRSRIAYPDGGCVYVVDIATGEASKVADGGFAAWLDDDTLIVTP
jgi:Tol biopolymer transport system component